MRFRSEVKETIGKVGRGEEVEELQDPLRIAVVDKSLLAAINEPCFEGEDDQTGVRPGGWIS